GRETLGARALDLVALRLRGLAHTRLRALRRGAPAGRALAARRTRGLRGRAFAGGGQYDIRRAGAAVFGGLATAQPRDRAEVHPLDQPEIDPASLEVDPRDLHVEFVGEAESSPGALTAQFVRRLVVLEVLAAEFRDVHQPLDIEVVQRDEHAERRHAGHAAGELLADALAHVHALEPGLDVARRLVGTALVARAGHAEHLPRLVLALARLGLRGRVFGGRRARTLAAPRTGGRRLRRELLGFSRVGGRPRTIATAAEQRLDHAVREQVRVAADGRREVRVGIVREAEVAGVVRRVDGLLHRAQQHRLQQCRVRARPHLRGQFGVIARRRLVAAAQREAHAAQELAKHLEALGRRALVHA